MLSNSKVWVSAMVLCAAVPALADTKIATKYVADGQTTETVTFIRGERLRYNYGKGQSLLRQCDLKRIVQVDDNAKTFLSKPADLPQADSTTPTSVVQTVDTGERKDMFGYQARHLTMVETTAGTRAHTETDGWYIDLKDMPSCSATSTAARSAAPSPGFPMAYTVTTFGENGKPTSTLTMQVTDLTIAPLETALFDVPAEYKDSSKAAEGPAIPKTAGVPRVGAVPMRNKSDQTRLSPAPYGHLLSELQAAKVDVMPLVDGPEETVKAKAVHAECDYILYTDLISVTKPPLSKVGGLLHKTPIVGKATDGDEYEARVDYKLIPLVEGAAPLESSAVVKKGHSFNWVGAAVLASNFMPMTQAARMLGPGLNPAMLNAVMRTAAPGSAMGNMDPMMGGMSMFLRAGSPMGGMGAMGAVGTVGAMGAMSAVSSAGAMGGGANAPNPAGMDAAIAAALDVQSKALVAHLKK
jgi:hypothetical protein